MVKAQIVMGYEIEEGIEKETEVICRSRLEILDSRHIGGHRAIQKYTQGLEFKSFSEDRRTVDAVVRN